MFYFSLFWVGKSREMEWGIRKAGIRCRGIKELNFHNKATREDSQHQTYRVSLQRPTQFCQWMIVPNRNLDKILLGSEGKMAKGTLEHDQTKDCHGYETEGMKIEVHVHSRSQSKISKVQGRFASPICWEIKSLKVETLQEGNFGYDKSRTSLSSQPLPYKETIPCATRP